MPKRSQEPLEEYDEQLLREMYSQMQLIREFETTLDNLIRRGEMHGNSHLGVGQEAVAVGTRAALQHGDLVSVSHSRSHGHVLASGLDPRRLMAEVGGKATGVSGGRGGEMHVFSVEDGLLETNGILGSDTAHMTGAMLACQLDGEDVVGVSAFGDGGLNEGIVAESMNLAAVWNLPVIFLCENNQYAITTPKEYAVAGEQISDRASGYGIPGKTIDGQDVLTVFEAVSDAAEAARDGGGPQFIECDTYRFSGHFTPEEKRLGEEQQYRSETEVQEMREKRDPIANFAAELEDAGMLNAAERQAIHEEVDRVIEDAITYMRDSEFPPAEDALQNVYANQEYANLPMPGYR